MGLRSLQSIFALNIAKLIIWAYQNGYELTFGDAYRDPYLAKINSGKYGLIDKITGVIEWLARRGSENSLHMRRLAVDINLFKDGKYLSSSDDHRPLAKYWESLHPQNRSGIRFNDGNHYEMAQYKWRDNSTKPL